MTAFPITGKRPTLPSLTGARWWAAVAVFLLHALVFLAVYPFQKGELFAALHRLVPMQLGSAGVTFFFVLSGFLIYWSNSDVRGARDIVYYLRRRFTKIYPMHWVALVLFVLASASISRDGITFALDFSRLELWVPNALLIHTWNPHWALLGGLNVPSWSLGAEMLFYISFPFIIPFVNKLTGSRTWFAFWSLFACASAVALSVHFIFEGGWATANAFVPRLWDMDISPVAEPHADPVWFQQQSIPVHMAYFFSYYFPLSRLVEFYMGALIAKLVAEGRFDNRKLLWPLVALVLSFGATWFVPVALKMAVMMLVPMCFVVGTLATRDLAGISGRIAQPRAVLLGNISFAFYLVQFPVMVFLQRYLIAGHSWGFLGWLGSAILSFLISLIVAWLMFTLIDDPLMKATARGPKRSRRRENILIRDARILLNIKH
ncbi:acyltransferase [Corynebacterium sp. ES2794-CONJ1]|uniref:acyltransferase family protein n=1 Tax=unclassified Corynebacterium TaxID=2624378 RepID=UPI002168E29E|nr:MULTISPECIES: acyltransferase [unclassified Corynebacterium]MCS4490199.1 acyltransferase [Corynebacterium sp. ES2775-CONJ]MCS4491990.1 acyltransferase [Corynebacterium sp. ES2715-CONJ3]MCS4532094.1 acyltransferase [Corynebacterium sp. ES2730-CONJ]MCU9519496.1 acyltransferase [Corynebacterium sp. ES2794-CONJ1]